MPLNSDPNAGVLTRAQMSAILARGETVGYRGKLIASVADLPDEATMAEQSDDPAAAEQTAAEIEARMERDRQALARLRAKPATETKQADLPASPRLFAGKPLSFYDGKTREQLVALPKVGEAIAGDILDAQAKRDAAAAERK